MIHIDIDRVGDLTVNADEIFLKPEGERVLVKLLDLQEQIENAISEAKIKLEVAALKANPNFSSIQANKVKVYYRAFGAKYYIDESNIKMAPKELYQAEEKVVYKIDTKAVDKWIDQHGGPPTGINEVERKKTLTFSLKTKGGDNE